MRHIRPALGQRRHYEQDGDGMSRRFMFFLSMIMLVSALACVAAQHSVTAATLSGQVASFPSNTSPSRSIMAITLNHTKSIPCVSAPHSILTAQRPLHYAERRVWPKTVTIIHDNGNQYSRYVSMDNAPLSEGIMGSDAHSGNTRHGRDTKGTHVGVFALASGTNGHAPSVTLNSGYAMPVAGIGTYALRGKTCINAVKYALEQGVRLIDTAYMYGNEKEVGQAVREFMQESGTPREDIFVITKIYPGEQFTHPEKAIQEALEKLDIGYIDMMLLHHPGDNDVNAYQAMEKAVADGKIRSLGLSNWYIEEIDNFIAQISIRPALIQNEIHPYYQEQAVIPYMHERGIVMQAWYPLGGRGHQKELLHDTTLVNIAAVHGVSVAQVILRWALQNGVVVIPGSSNPKHIQENIALFDFALTAEDMAAIARLDRNEKHDWY